MRSCYINKQSKHDFLGVSEKLSVIQQEIDSNLLQQQFLSGSQAVSSFCCCKLCQSSHLFFFHLPLEFLILIQNSAKILPLETGNNATKVCYTYSSHGSRGSSPSYSSIASIIFLRKWTPRTSSLSSNQAGNR